MARRVAVRIATALALGLLIAATASPQDFGGAEEAAKKAFAQKNYSPYAGRGYPTRVFFGDTHLNTMLSVDAGAFGNRLGLEEARRAAFRREDAQGSAAHDAGEGLYAVHLVHAVTG